MKNSYIIAGVVALVVIAGIAAFAFNQNKMTTTVDESMNGQATTTTTTNTKGTTTTAPKKTTTTTTTTTTSNGPSAPEPTGVKAEVQSFVVNGNDTTADLKRIVVPAGTNVSITFGADAKGTYHGGLDFRSAGVSTGTIVPGATQRISFVATKSFSFIPYWPDTNEAKPYTIDIVVTTP